MGLFDDYIQDGSTAPDQVRTHANTSTRGQYSPTERERVFMLTFTVPEHVAIDTSDTGDPLEVLNDLPLMADDKNYLNGALAILPVPNALKRALLAEYRRHWLVAAKRHTRPNGQDNAGRRAANRWVLGGCHGVVSISKT